MPATRSLRPPVEISVELIPRIMARTDRKSTQLGGGSFEFVDRLCEYPIHSERSAAERTRISASRAAFRVFNSCGWPGEVLCGTTSSFDLFRITAGSLPTTIQSDDARPIRRGECRGNRDSCAIIYLRYFP